MLSLLQDRQTGLDPPWLLPRLYASQRFTAIKLSMRKEFPKTQPMAITSLDIDKPSGRYIIAGSSNKTGSIAIYDTQPNSNGVCPVVAKTYTPPSGPDLTTSHAICTVQWYPHDTGMFSTSAANRSVKVWDTNEMIAVENFKFPNPLYTHSMAAAKSHCLIAAAGEAHEVTLCDIQSGSSTHILASHTQPVMSLAWSPLNDHTLASGSQDNRVLIWDIRKATGPLLSLDQHNGSGASNTSAVVTSHAGHVNGLCYSSDGLHLLSYGTDDRLKLWDAFTGKNTLINYGRCPNSYSRQCVQFTVTPHTLTLHPIVCLPSAGNLMLVEMLTGKTIKHLQGHFGNVNCVINHPFEQELFSGGSDANIVSWEPPSLIPKPRKRSSGLSVYQDDWSSDED